MAKTVNRLTDLKVKKAGIGLRPDGDGLYLQVSGEQARSWLYRYTPKGHGRERYMGLGSYPSTSLETARLERDKYKALRQAGQDPIEARAGEETARKLEASSSVTFSEAVAGYIKAKSSGWKNAKHREQWTNSLKTYAEPTLGTLPVGTIDAVMVQRVLEPIWTTKPETASRLRGRIEMVLDWAKTLGYRAGENPARWRGHLEHVFARRFEVREVKHHPALDYAEIPDFMAKLRAQDNTAARALEWIVLTVVRANEALKAVPAEVSQRDKAWTIPGARMKARKQHRVPLGDRALEVMESVARDERAMHLFPGLRKGKPLSDAALRVLLRRMGYPNITTHGFRATFRTWAQEKTNFPHEILESVLAHAIGDKTVEAYNRGELFDKRRKVIEAWAAYCSSKPNEKRDNVTSINEGRKATAG